MVRHEAAEALGAINQPGCEDILEEFQNDSALEARRLYTPKSEECRHQPMTLNAHLIRVSAQVAQTCQLALGRIRYWRNRRAEEASAAGAAGGAPAAAPAGELKGSKKEQFSAAFAGEDAAAARAGEESGSPFLSGQAQQSCYDPTHLLCEPLLEPHSNSSARLQSTAQPVASPHRAKPPVLHSAVDPVPPADDSVSLDALCEMLRSEDTGMFDRYRAMFALRNRGSKDLASLLVSGRRLRVTTKS